MSEREKSNLNQLNPTAGFQSIPTPDYSGRSDFAGSGKTLLLGLGNDILCDDAIGLLVAREIRKRLSERRRLASDAMDRGQPVAGSSVDVRETSEMGLALLDYIVGYSKLIVVDAIQTRTTPPGFIHELDGTDLKLIPVTSPHFLGVGEMIALGKKLGLQVPDQVKIFAIEIEDAHTVTERLTPTLQNALPKVVDRVWSVISR